MAGIKMRLTKNDFPAIAKNVPIRRRVVVQRRGEQIVEIAKAKSRYDASNTEDGHKHMRDGWQWVETNQGGRLENDVEHTSYNEYGTSKMSAQPMARPAFAEVVPLIIKDLSDESLFKP
jgi:HK97 gp10 family phage protein